MTRLLRLIPAAAFVVTVACGGGVGPTDAGITTDVRARLAADEAVSAFNVNVDTRDQVVTLTGSVDSVATKERIVSLTRQSSGVRDVIDNIRVDSTAATSGGGSSVTDSLRSAEDAAIGAGAAAGAATAGAVQSGADAIGRGAEATAGAVVDGAEAVGRGAEAAGREVKDAVTGEEKR